MSNTSEFFDKLGKYSSWALLVSPWILFLVCYLLTPKWILTENALSDFGNPEFTKYYLVYNVGLIILAIIIWLMSLGIVARVRNKVQVFAGAFWFVAGIFLALIGYYHEGTYPHVFVSVWFFVQGALAIGIMGIGTYIEKDIKSSIIQLIIALFMPLGAIIVHFPSAATEEIYEISLMDVWLIFYLLYTPLNKSVKVKGTEIHHKRDAIAVGTLATIFFVLGAIVIAFAFK